jgi:ABC-type glycerol-3-phosphate transport system substrate-binding protein
VAIAGSKYHFNIFDEMMFQPLTYGGLGKIDYNRDGTADKDETFVGFATNRVSLSTPAYRARLKMAREVGGFCQAGYTGLTRDEGVFLFAQQRAVFIPTGTWDAGSLQEQARGKFAIAVMDFPVPAPDDPEFGRFMPGPRYERPSSQFAFGVTRTSQHKEVALDFLFFLASQKGNEKLNGIIGWIPAIEGTKVDPFLAPFQPHLQGIYAALDLNLGGETWVKWQQLYSLFQVNQISLEDFTAQFDDYYRNRGAVDFAERVNTWRRDAQRYEQLLAGMRAKAMFPAPGQDAEQESKWIRYRSATAKQIGREINGNHLLAQIKRGPDATATTPATYEYSPEALAAIRERVRNTPPKKSP